MHQRQKCAIVICFKMTVDNFYSACTAPSGAYKHFFEGQWVESSSGKVVKILNPSTNAPEYEVQGKLRLQ